MLSKIFVLCDFQRNSANTIVDHSKSFFQYGTQQYYYFNPLKKSIPVWLDIKIFDILVIHYSIYSLSDLYLNTHWCKTIRNFQGLKVQFIQDEYRKIDQIVEKIKSLKIDVLFTCHYGEAIEKIYPRKKLPGLIKYNTLTGYVPGYMENPQPDLFTKARKIDVGYRARGVGQWWLGELYQEKSRIGIKFLRYIEKHNKNIVCDISSAEKDRLYGRKWDKFLRNCTCFLGTESGASVIDLRGEIENKVRTYVELNKNATFEEIQNLFFKKLEYKIKMNQISPRIFEAIGSGCGLILYPGSYSNILVKGLHYIELKKDFSNIEEVLKKIGNKRFLNQMVQRSYTDIILSGKYSYQNFVLDFEKKISHEYQKIKTRDRGSFSIEFSTPGLREAGLTVLRIIFWMLKLTLSFPLIILSLPFQFGYLIFEAIRNWIQQGGGEPDKVNSKPSIELTRLIRFSKRTVKAPYRIMKKIITQPIFLTKEYLRLYWLALSARKKSKVKTSIDPGKKIERNSNQEGARFWEELSGTHGWHALGLGGVNTENIRKFDEWYLEKTYPYLYKYLELADIADKDILEIGLGFGTLGEKVFLRAKGYMGLDIARNPLKMMNRRISNHRKMKSANVVQGDSRSLPFKDEVFDRVISIGCLHHSGDVPGSVNEIYRVLKEGGNALIMLYNKNSSRRRIVNPVRYLAGKIQGNLKYSSYAEFERSTYDMDSTEKAAPVTAYSSRAEVRRLLARFEKVDIKCENFDDLNLFFMKLPRKYLLKNLARIWGLDLYIRAHK